MSITESATRASTAFISYAREDQPFVRRLAESFAAADRTLWVDWQDIAPSAEWWAEILGAISGTDALIAIVSPDLATSSHCTREIAHAVASNKRIIPLLRRAVASAELPDAIRTRNWIDVRSDDDYQAAFGTLLAAIDTDLEWVKAHTRLTVRSEEWERSGRDRSFLLRGRDLTSAGLWLDRVADHAEPSPTALQRTFLGASRNADARYRRNRIAVAVAGSIIAVVLAGAAAIQGQVASQERARAEDQAELNRARALGTAASRQDRLDVSLLLAVEAFEIRDVVETRDRLSSALSASPKLRRYLWGATAPIVDVGVAEDGSWIAAATEQSILVWSAATGQPEATVELEGTGSVTTIAVSPDGAQLAYGTASGVVGFLAPAAGFAEERRFETTDRISTMAFHPNGTMLAVAGDEDGSAVLVDTRSGKRIAAWRANSEAVRSLAFAPDGMQLVSAAEGTLATWDFTRPTRPTALGEGVIVKDSVATALAYNAEGHWLGMATLDAALPLVLWARDTGQQRFLILAGMDAANDLAFDRPGRRLVAAVVTNGLNRVYSWDLPEGGWTRDVILGLNGHRDTIKALSFGPDDALLVSGAVDGSMIQWDLSRPALVPSMEPSAQVQALCAIANRRLTAEEASTYLGDGVPARGCR